MKSSRQNLICELISQYEIETQDELVARLEKLGMKVTQATVSRDIRELHLTKTTGKSGKICYTLPGDDGKEQSPITARRFARVLQEGFVSCEAAGNLIVVRTMTGMANAVAVALESLHLDDVVGTIAGDDTIFMAVRSPQAASDLVKQVEELIDD